MDSGHIDVLKFLTRQGLDLNQSRGNKGTLLHVATEKGGYADVRVICQLFVGDVMAVKYLLWRGANIEAADEQGTTSLMIAAAKSSLRLVNILLEAGADVNALDQNGDTAIHLGSSLHSHRKQRLIDTVS